MKVTQRVEELLRPMITGMGYLLDEVEYQKEQGNWVLTLYIEHQDGSSVTLDDCEAVSRAADPLLDEADPIEQAYYLSVSSIGLDRPLKKDRDFERNLGKDITVKLYAPLKGKKELTGRLAAFDEASLTIALNKGGEELKLLRKDAASIKPYIDFNKIVNTAEEIEE